jgi:hypothetical protein
VTRSLGVAALLFVVATIASTGAQSPQAPQRAEGRAPQTAAPASRPAPAADPAFVKQYCVSCHNDRVKAGTFSLDGVSPAAVEGHADTWERVVRKLRTGMMPPPTAPQPPSAVRAAFVASLETSLDRAAARRPDPGIPALHRLNRTEYANAVRDLVALDVDVAALLPPDDAAAGFDNIADVLGTSPALIEGYAAAAASISRRVMGDPAIGLDRSVYRVPGDFTQDAHVDGMPLGTRGGIIIRHTFPLDAEYDFQVGQAGGGRLGGPPAAGPRTDDLYVTIDGTRVTLQGGRGGTRLKVAAGPRTIAAATVVRSHSAGADGVFDVDARSPGITQIAIAGPFNPTGSGDTPSRRRVLICTPKTPDEELPCARRILSTLATRAYRRPVAASSADLDVLLEFYRAGRQRTFDFGIQRALARVLVDPQFLFRFEREPASVAPGTAYAVSDLELASRLSFFLWSSLPDDDLLAAAERGDLKRPALLERQVRRMLADQRADALVTNFASQWLSLRELQNARPDAPSFDGNLRQSFQRETELLFRAVLREDRSITDLLDAGFTHVDERLARHYGMTGIRGSRMRRVDLAADSPRRGLLGHGSVLTVTSAANRTSPVLRGKWVLESLLGAPPPQPPPGVETNLDGDPAATKATSLRQRLERHRANAACASCHRIMDPLGFALENFDHAGAWRTVDGATPVDASGEMADGTRLDGVASLREALRARRALFVATAAEKMLTYAIGRAVRPEDMPSVRAVTRAAAAQNDRFSALVLGVIQTPQFRMRTRSGG